MENIVHENTTCQNLLGTFKAIKSKVFKLKLQMIAKAGKPLQVGNRISLNSLRI